MVFFCFFFSHLWTWELTDARSNSLLVLLNVKLIAPAPAAPCQRCREEKEDVVYSSPGKDRTRSPSDDFRFFKYFSPLSSLNITWETVVMSFFQMRSSSYLLIRVRHVTLAVEHKSNGDGIWISPYRRLKLSGECSLRIKSQATIATIYETMKESFVAV